MAKCKNCTNLYNMSNENDEIVGKWCPKTNDSPDVESERECRHYKCMTQADRIRSMSDEELAEFLTHINPTNCQDCAFSHGWRCQPDRDDYSSFEKCKEGRKRWLQQPAKETKK